MVSESPYAPPKSGMEEILGSGIYSKAGYVIYNPDVAWPPRCYKCNAETNIRKEMKLTYVNPWIYLSLVITPIVTIILAMVFQKKFNLDLPVCELHTEKHKKFVRLQWGIVTLFLVVIFLGIALKVFFFFIISTLLFLIIVVSAIIGRLVYPERFKNGRLWVKGTGEEFRKSLPEFSQ